MGLNELDRRVSELEKRPMGGGMFSPEVQAMSDAELEKASRAILAAHPPEKDGEETPEDRAILQRVRRIFDRRDGKTPLPTMGRQPPGPAPRPAGAPIDRVVREAAQKGEALKEDRRSSEKIQIEPSFGAPEESMDIFRRRTGGGR